MPKKLKGKVKQVWESKIKQSPSKNKHISYSSISTYNKCPKLWELQYLRNAVPFTQNIYTCFGTAMHETIQEWLTVMYHDKVKAANDINLHKLLYANLVKAYKQGLAINGSHFSTPEELTQFWLDGKHILDYLTKKRAAYFSTKTMMLAGVETLLYQEIKPGVMFKGLIDLVFYHPVNDTWTIMDIKTSTSGWRDNQKKNPNLTAQVVLYKDYWGRKNNIKLSNIQCGFVLLKKVKTVGKSCQLIKVSSGPKTLEKSAKLVSSMISTVSKGMHLKNRDSCMFCEFKGTAHCN